MDSDQIEQSEIVLGQGPPIWMGRCMWGGAFVLSCWLSIASSRSGVGLPPLSNPLWLFISLFCGVGVLLRFRFGLDRRWRIGTNEMDIDSDGDGYQFVRSGDILEIEILEPSRWSGDRFRLRLWLASGRRYESPKIEGPQGARELKAEITRRLNVPH